MKDKVFATPGPVTPFVFDEKVAACFDDMVARSVPYYAQVHALILDVLEKRMPNQALLVDLGCSTGTTIAIIHEHFKHQRSLQFIGVDNSQAMAKKCEQKWQALSIGKAHVVVDDLQKVKLPPCQVVIMNYTLQFIPTADRPELLKNIFSALSPGGIFILAEKIQGPDPLMHDLMTELYYDFKRRQGYSELEISQKREALENVLVPLTPEENMAQLRECGFQHVDMLFKWYNFASFVAIK